MPQYQLLYVLYIYSPYSQQMQPRSHPNPHHRGGGTPWTHCIHNHPWGDTKTMGGGGGLGTWNIHIGWWLTYPSEKYESQLGWLLPISGKIKNVPNHQPVYILYLEKSISYGTKMANENVTSSAFFSERPNRPTPSSKPARKADSTKGFGCSQVASQNFGKRMRNHQILAENQEVP